MGAWGDGPRDSDQALDWLYEPAAHAAVDIWRLLARSEGKGDFYYHELRAAADLYVRMDLGGIALGEDAVNPDGEHLQDVLRERLEGILNDSEWIEGWRDPQEVRDALKCEIEKLKDERVDEKIDRLEKELG